MNTLSLGEGAEGQVRVGPFQPDVDFQRKISPCDCRS